MEEQICTRNIILINNPKYKDNIYTVRKNINQYLKLREECI